MYILFSHHPEIGWWNGAVGVAYPAFGVTDWELTARQCTLTWYLNLFYNQKMM
jgi:hypothetical protein